MISRANGPFSVLHVVPSLRFGGAERLVVGLCNHLAPAVVEARICALEPQLLLADALRPGTSGILTLKCRGPHLGRLKNWFEAMRLRRLLRELRPDIVHAHLPMAVVLARMAAWRLPVRTVVTWQNVASASSGGAVGWRLAGTRRPGPPRYAAVSKAVADCWAGRLGVDPSRVRVIPNGAEIERFTAMRRPSTEGREEGPRLLCVARFSPQKNHSRLLRAFALLVRRVPGCRLRLVGTGPTQAETRALALQLGLGQHIEFVAPHTDIEKDYAQSDVFVLASDWEGMPLVLIEAMASGLPVVATRVGGNAEVVREGIDGYLVPPGKPEFLSEMLERLLLDETSRMRMGASGRERAAAEFSMRACAARYQDLYREVLASPIR